MVKKFTPGPSHCRYLVTDGQGLPVYWANVWMLYSPSGSAQSTLVARLRYLDAFYGHCESVLGRGALDDALTDCDVDSLSAALESYYLKLRRSSQNASSQSYWSGALSFVLQIAERRALAGGRQVDHSELQSRVKQVELTSGKLHIGSRRRPERVRALPSAVVEWLMQVLDPESASNPFRTGRSRWLSFAYFTLCLHLGLRPSEPLLLTTDAIRSGFDHKRRTQRLWLAVQFNPNEDDPRSSTPSLKTPTSVRELPMSPLIEAIVTEYAINYRGRPNHTFLFNSQKMLPWSSESVRRMFQEISKVMPEALRRELLEKTGCDKISAHDLRHTCAVLRLNQMLSSGLAMDDAIQRLRVFFGWARESKEPMRYARALFESRLATLWNEKFDDHAEMLRSLPA